MVENKLLHRWDIITSKVAEKPDVFPLAEKATVFVMRKIDNHPHIQRVLNNTSGRFYRRFVQ